MKKTLFRLLGLTLLSTAATTATAQEKQDMFNPERYESITDHSTGRTRKEAWATLERQQTRT